MLLVACLMLLDFLILWLLALTKRAYWAPVIALALVVGVLNFFVVNAFNSGNGWPAPGFPTNKSFMFLGCTVHPPSGDDPGAIYLLVEPPAQSPKIGYKSAPQSPRLFGVPFSNELAQQCQKAQKAGMAGVPIKVKKSAGKKGKKGENGVRLPKMHFYHLPPSAVEPKH